MINAITIFLLLLAAGLIGYIYGCKDALQDIEEEKKDLLAAMLYKNPNKH